MKPSLGLSFHDTFLKYIFLNERKTPTYAAEIRVLITEDSKCFKCVLVFWNLMDDL